MNQSSSAFSEEGMLEKWLLGVYNSKTIRLGTLDVDWKLFGELTVKLVVLPGILVGTFNT